MKPEITHELKDGRPIGAQRGFAATFNWMLNFCRNLTGGPGVTVDRTDSDHPIIRVGEIAAAPSEGITHFKCRFHTTEDDDGKWEVFMKIGSLSVGNTCTPINTKMADVSGHEDDKDWYLLYIDESEGQPSQTRTETATNAQGESQSITVNVRKWNVEVHGKTSAKIEGVDQLDATARRLVYVAARKVRGSGDSAPTAAEQQKYCWGDEFSQVVGTITVETKPDLVNGGTITTRKYEATVKNAISVAGRPKTNFDLVWYLEVDEDGDLDCTAVYCVRNSQSVAGMTVNGPTMVDVTDAQSGIWIMIVQNGSAGSVGSRECILSVVVDPSNQQSDDYTTWLKLYDMQNNVVMADYRTTALVNVLVFR